MLTGLARIWAWVVSGIEHIYSKLFFSPRPLRRFRYMFQLYLNLIWGNIFILSIDGSTRGFNQTFRKATNVWYPLAIEWLWSKKNLHLPYWFLNFYHQISWSKFIMTFEPCLAFRKAHRLCKDLCAGCIGYWVFLLRAFLLYLPFETGQVHVPALFDARKRKYLYFVDRWQHKRF